MTFWSLFSCNKNENVIENKYIKIEKLSEYHNITNPKNNDILFLVKFTDFGNEKTKGGLQSIFSIDNIQHNILQKNSELIEDSKPEEILLERLKSIENECKDSNFNWKDFKIVNDVKATTFKGYKSAVAEFEVKENVKNLNTTIQKRIKRYTVFVKNDLWNIVIAPTNLQNYETEMKDFENMIETLKIK